jgi:AraC-like DNA-binding protein
MQRPSLVVNPQSLERYLHYMSSLGFKSEDVLAGSGLQEAELARKNRGVDIAQFKTVLRNMFALTGDPGLGIKIGSSVKLSQFGVAGHAILSATTARQVSVMTLNFCQSLLGLFMRGDLIEHLDGSWSLEFTCAIPEYPILQFCTEDMLLIGVCLARDNFELPVVVRSIDFAYPEPPWSADYEGIFPTKFRFDQPRTAICIESPSLDRPVRSNQDEFAEFCLRCCSGVMDSIKGDAPVSASLRAMFLQRTREIPSSQEAAAFLGLGERTLRRRLADEATSYQQLVAQFRESLAIEYLESGHLSPKQIAYTLGYHSQSEFCRAFKRWTGATVTDYFRVGKPYFRNTK